MSNLINNTHILRAHASKILYQFLYQQLGGYTPDFNDRHYQHRCRTIATDDMKLLLSYPVQPTICFVAHLPFCRATTNRARAKYMIISRPYPWWLRRTHCGTPAQPAWRVCRRSRGLLPTTRKIKDAMKCYLATTTLALSGVASEWKLRV